MLDPPTTVSDELEELEALVTLQRGPKTEELSSSRMG
jgi:hypothetical protein